MFKPSGTLLTFGAPVLRNYVIANSAEATLLDSVKLSSGFCALGTTGALVLGHINGISTQYDMPLLNNGLGADFTTTYTVASDNQTVGKITAKVDISKFTLYSADPDDTIATTTGSNLAGYFTDLHDEDETDESTASTTTAQYAIHGVDPADATNHIVSIYESVVFGV